MAKANHVVGAARHVQRMQVQAKLLGIKPLVCQKQPQLNFIGFGGRRNFSSNASSESSSIFDEAEFDDGEYELEADFSRATEPTLPYFDDNDTFAALASSVPKDFGNLHNGIHTYGIWEYIVFLDDLFYNSWLTAAQTGSMGLTFGLIISTLATRLFFMPSSLYSQIVGHKMKLLQPDNDEI
jgi:hypothetical protein